MPPKTPAERSKAYRERNRNNEAFKAKNRERKARAYVPRHILAQEDPERLQQIREAGKVATALYRTNKELQQVAVPQPQEAALAEVPPAEVPPAGTPRQSRRLQRRGPLDEK